MVLENPFQSSHKGFTRRLKGQSLLSDRLRAIAFDFFLLTPLISFISMPFYRTVEQVIYAQPEAMSSFSLWASLLGLVSLVFITVQAAFLVVLQATPGMKVFKLSCQSVEGGRVSFPQAIFRSFGLWLSLLTLGVPFLSILTNAKNQAWYDQMVGLRVISEKAEIESLEFPVFKFQQISHALTTLSVTLLVLLFASAFSEETQYWLQAKPADQAACSQVIEKPDTSRIASALELFEHGFIDSDCLSQEALNAAFSEDQTQLHLARLARYLTVDDPQLAKKYFDSLCAQSTSELCREAARLTASSASLLSSYKAATRTQLKSFERMSERREGF